jgi:ribosomal protein L16
MLKRNHKGRLNNIYNSSQFLLKNKYALIAAEEGRVTKSELYAFELAIKRIIKNNKGEKNKAYLRIHPHLNLTKKSLGVRMGKGKGSIYTQFTRVRPGAILIEWANQYENPFNIWSILNSKISIKTHLVSPKH